MSTKPIYHVADAIICGLGNNSAEVYKRIAAGESGIKIRSFETGWRYPVATLSEEQDARLQQAYPAAYSRFERMCLWVAEQAFTAAKINPEAENCLIILSSTKGNIRNLSVANQEESVPLHYSANKIGAYFKGKNKILTVSVACISGAAAQIIAKRWLRAGLYKHAVIIGCDELSPFVLAGFHSFQALSAEACRPFDAHRSGLNLGEAAACLILSTDERVASGHSELIGGAITNDANHLSGPSKTGAELGMAIIQSLQEARLAPEQVSFVTAHGTATNYNDEMEAKALHFAGISAPVNSLKSYLGHTLGASGLIETIISIRAMQANELIPTRNFESSSFAVPINVIKEKKQAELANFVKTAAGFGGCNAALVWAKI